MDFQNLFKIRRVNKRDLHTGAFEDVFNSVRFFVHVDWHYRCTQRPRCKILDDCVNVVMRNGCDAVFNVYSAAFEKVSCFKNFTGKLLISEPDFISRIRIKDNILVIRLQMPAVLEKLKYIAVFDEVFSRANASDKVRFMNFLLDSSESSIKYQCLLIKSEFSRTHNSVSFQI